MTPEERAALAGQTQRQAGVDVTPVAAQTEAQIRQTEKDNDLGNPETQAKIELPKTVTLRLRLEGEIKVCDISTEFTHEQVYDWELLEDLQSFAILLRGELRKTRFQPGDNDAYQSALTKSRVRSAVREILTKIARYREPWTTRDARGREIPHLRPTEEEIRTGLLLDNGEPNLYAMRELADVLFGMYLQEVERQKNVRAAADLA